MLQRFLAGVLPFAQALGGPGLALLAFLDSSFLSFPEVTDALIVVGGAVIKNVGTPMSFNRVTVLGASLVCNVLNTVWPVSEA